MQQSFRPLAGIGNKVSAIGVYQKYSLSDPDLAYFKKKSTQNHWKILNFVKFGLAELQVTMI